MVAGKRWRKEWVERNKVGCISDLKCEKQTIIPCQRELFLSEVNNRETIAAIEVNNDMYCLEKQIEMLLLEVEFFN